MQGDGNWVSQPWRHIFAEVKGMISDTVAKLERGRVEAVTAFLQFALRVIKNDLVKKCLEMRTEIAVKV